MPKVAESLNVAAYNLQHRFGDPGDAAAVYQRAIAADPKFSWPSANLGRLYMDWTSPSCGLEWLQTAVRLDPNHFRAWVNLGVALLLAAAVRRGGARLPGRARRSIRTTRSSTRTSAAAC